MKKRGDLKKLEREYQAEQDVIEAAIRARDHKCHCIVCISVAALLKVRGGNDGTNSN